MEDVGDVPVTTDRWAPVWLRWLLRKFPSPTTLDHLDVNNSLQEAVDAWFYTPWFRTDAIAAGSMCDRYVDAKG